MLTFMLRRLAQVPLVVFALTVMVVALLQLLSPAERASGYVTNEQQSRNLGAIIRERGLDQPFAVQYGRWVAGAVRGDLGYSRTSGQPVLTTLRQRLPQTIELTLFAAVPIIACGVWLGTLAALNRDRWLDHAIRLLAIVGVSLPTFVLGILFLVMFYGVLGWLPGSGNVSVAHYFELSDPDFRRITGLVTLDALLAGRWSLFADALRHLLLPALTLAVVSSGNIIAVIRAQLLDALTSDYVRTARAKGLPERRVNLGHARRNALLPVLTLSGFAILGLLSGSIITETIFGYPGIGQWAGSAAQQFDVPAVLGFALFSALLVVVVSALIDLLYGLVDPRVRFD